MIEELAGTLEANRTSKLAREIANIKGTLQDNALSNGLKRIEDAISSLQADGMPIDNLDEIKKHLRDEFSLFVKQLTLSIRDAVAKVSYEIKIPENIKIDNYQDLAKTLKNLERIMNGKEWSPNINVSVPDVIVPKIELPTINVPAMIIPEQKAPIVNFDISSLLDALKPLGYISNKASKPIAVRMSDGQDFIKALKAVAQATDNASKQMTVFSNNSGMTKDEFKAASKELVAASTGSNTSATVGVASGVIVAAKTRFSVILTNDSDTTIYVAKGATATLNNGIRLNANGGSVIIEDWNGAISAISSGASKNICICEAY